MPDVHTTPPNATSDRLRADIDRGRTGDKVPMSDPAAAPLGTDDEAAGASPSRGRMAQAYRTEAAKAGRRTDEHAARTLKPSYGVLVAICALVVAMVAALLLAT
jgi:hypothetical protein